MFEQLNIFSFIEQEKYCFDDDINDIHKKLISLADKYKISISKDEFAIWAHVPQYGFRLWLDMNVTKENLQDDNFRQDIEEIIAFSNKRNIELSCMTGACFFYKGEKTASLPFCTTFKDKKRQKIK